jgi:hypothetical protein
VEEDNVGAGLGGAACVLGGLWGLAVEAAGTRYAGRVGEAVFLVVGVVVLGLEIVRPGRAVGSSYRVVGRDSLDEPWALVRE